MQNHYNTIIIGGGASGMFAAIFASQNGQKVLILEKNTELGRKLKITGGGRCNIYNAQYDLQKLSLNYGVASKYLQTAFSIFGPAQVKNYFEQIGIPTYAEDRLRAFPKTQKAQDVFNALSAQLQKNNVQVILNAKVAGFVQDATTNLITGIKVNGSQNIYTADKYILATGGYSHPETGSTGDGFAFLASLGVAVAPATPSLVPLATNAAWVINQSGKTIENSKITFLCDDVKKRVLKVDPETKNRILFTHFGLSGPTILNNSKFVADLLKEGEVTLSLDIMPTLNEKQVDTHLLVVFVQNKNKDLKNILNQIYPGNLLQEIFDAHKINTNIKVHSITALTRRQIVSIFKNLQISITSLMGFDKAIIADGGVELAEVNFANMSLKKVPNVCVTGDMLNITRPSGGFSLQLCWTTGYLAATK